MNGQLSIAEQCIDRQTKTELFQGREIELVTGRVLLHALDDQGQPLCSYDQEQLTPIDRPWDAGYLPHLPRCRSCMTQAADTPVPDRPGNAVDVDIRTTHDTDRENAGAAALRAVLAEHGLRRWMFTDLVPIDETLRGGLSHPLAGPAAPLRRRRRRSGFHLDAPERLRPGIPRPQRNPRPLRRSGRTAPTRGLLRNS